MAITSKIEEKQLHKIWDDQDFIDDLKTPDGDLITVLNPGEPNLDSSGPDFKHARIKIGNLTFVGDVEIDFEYNDWKKHGHNINKHYNKVILHITYFNRQNQHYTYTSDGRRIFSVPIHSVISGDNLKYKLTLGGKSSNREFELKCSSESSTVSEIDRRNFLKALGISRFKNKRDRIYRRLKELKFISELELKEPIIRYELTEEFNKKKFTQEDFNDKQLWSQLLYELIFEALGYSKNKNIMMKLAQNIRLDFLSKLNGNTESLSQLEAVYFNIAGLMPETIESEETSDKYVKELNETWNSISYKYDGKRFNETQWHFLGQRPQNFPTIRIAGGARIVRSILENNLVGTIIKKFTEINSIKVLINSVRSLFIIKASGYWREHYVFEKLSNVKLNYIVGLSRADEIFINILLPFLSVYFDVFGNDDLSKKVLKVYSLYEQKSDNKIVRTVAEGLNLQDIHKRTIYSQGMIEVYRNYCTKNRCTECEIGKKIFT